MSSDFNFTVTSWFVWNFCKKPYFNTQGEGCPSGSYSHAVVLPRHAISGNYSHYFVPCLAVAPENGRLRKSSSLPSFHEFFIIDERGYFKALAELALLRIAFVVLSGLSRLFFPSLILFCDYFFPLLQRNLGFHSSPKNTSQSQMYRKSIFSFLLTIKT